MKRFKSEILIITTAFVLILATNVTFAWFTAISNSVSPQINGGLVKEYFHCGSGTEDDPFVITRPAHYYHMVEFFERTTALPLTSEQTETKYALFGKDYLYFQIGYPLDSDDEETYYVYEYNDDGTYKTDSDGNPELSRSLNMQCYSGENALMPLGSSEVPFVGAIDGKGTEVRNLNIVSKSTVKVRKTDTDEVVSVERTTSDIGVFGYVGKGIVAEGETETPTKIADIYFSNVNIDLKDLTIGVNGEKNDTAEEHPDDQHGTGTQTAYVGYLAGHVYTTTNISNVYVNESTITGGESAKNGFGMFGYIYDPVAGKEVLSLGEYIKTLNPNGEQDWGGSIDMQRLYERVRYAYEHYSKEYASTYNYKYYSGVTQITESDDTTVTSKIEGTYYIRDFSNGYYLWGKQQETQEEIMLGDNVYGGFTITTNGRSLYVNTDNNKFFLMTSSSTTFYIEKADSEYYMYVDKNGSKYYVLLNGSSLTLSQTERSPLILSSTVINDDISGTSIKFGDKYLNQRGSSMSYLMGDTASSSFKFTKTKAYKTVLSYGTGDDCTQTYFPINTGTEKDSDGNVIKNTGYFASGNSDGIRMHLDAYKDYQTVYTINSDGKKEKSDSDADFYKVKQNCSVTSGGSGYGLHFMDAAVDANNLYTLSSAKIGDATYEDRQMVANSVDFIVEKKGYIRFIAGTSYTNNNSFFTLYHISRSDDGKTVTAIKEISKIYSKGSSYFYAYVGETDNYGADDSYTLEFDCSWITTPEDYLSDDALYYFAIPVNAGEYALGSGTDRIGAYLYYLDIGSGSSGATEAVIGTKDGNKLSDTFCNIDYRSRGDLSESLLIQFSVVAPLSTAEDFSVKVVFEVDSDCDGYGIYKIYVNTAVDVELLVCMFDDDDDVSNEYKYGYQIYYGGTLYKNGEENYFQSANKFIIASDGVTTVTESE